VTWKFNSGSIVYSSASNITALGQPLKVIGAVSGSSTLEVVGNTFIGGNLSVTGNITHGGTYSPTNISSSGTLQMVGATILGSTLNVTGAATMAGKVSVDNEISGSGTLQAVGATTLGNTLSVSGTVSVAGDIDHAGDPDTYLRFLANTVNLVAGGKSAIKLDTSTGKIQLNNGNDDLNVQVMADDGEVILHADAGTNKVGINTESPSDALTVVGAISGSGTLQMVGNTFLGGTLNVTGNADFDGTVTCDTSLTIDSTTISAAEIGVLDGVSAGTAAASKAVVLDGSKNIATIGTVGCGAITSTGNSSYGTLTGGAISSSATLQAVGNTILGGNLNLSGTFTHAGTYSPTNISSSGTLQMVGATTLGNTLNVTGTATLAGKLSIDNEISGSGTLQMVGNTFLGGTLNVTGALLAGANVTLGDAGTDVTTVSGRLTGSQGAYFNSRVGIGTATPSDELHISASTSVVVIESYESSIAQILFKQAGENYGRIQVGGGGVFNIENLAENEDLVFKVNDADTTRTALTLDASVSEVIVNNGSDSLVDFRVESDSNTHMLFVDGGLDTVGINNSAPTHELTIGGNVSGSGTLENVGNTFLGGTLNVTGAATMAGKVSVDNEISGSGTLQAAGATTLGAALHVSGNVGLGMSSPKVALDVHMNPTALSDDTGGGEVAVWGTEDGSDTLAAGKLMCLNTSGVWVYADADAVSTSGGVLLAIALGTSISDGLLLRGYFDAATIQGSFVKGGVCYVSENAGVIDFTRPSAGGDVVRVVGYGTNTANVIYFNPSGDWIEL